MKVQSNSEIVGLDLGTTKSAVAVYTDAGPKVIPNSDGQLKTRSCVYFGQDGKEILVGDPAYNMQVAEPHNTFQHFKLEAPDKVLGQQGGLQITPLLCFTRMIRFLKESVAKYTGCPSAATMAVATVPSDADERFRQMILKAIEDAGIKPLGLISEPTAACLDYAENNPTGQQRVLIYDAGGGTTDVTVVAFNDKEATTLASNGIALAGKHFDEILMQVLVEPFRAKHGLVITKETHPADYFALQELAETNKEFLSAREELKLVARVDGKKINRHYSRQEYNQSLEPMLQQCEGLIEKTLKDAGIQAQDVDHVVPVGGSSKTPAIIEMLKRKFGAEKVRGGNVDPDLAIVCGAAAQAATLASRRATMVDKACQVILPPDLKHTDVVPNNLGVAVLPDASSLSSLLKGDLEERNCVHLHKNAPITEKVTHRYGAVQPQQRQFEVKVLQGEDNAPTSNCLLVASKVVEFAPRDPGTETVELTMSYDPASGLVQVTVKDLISAQVQHIEARFYSDPPEQQVA